MRAEEIDALLGGEAQRLADKYTSVPLDFMDGYGWAVTQICRLFPEVVPVRHGKWIVEWETEDTRMLRCSECRMVFNVGKGRDGNYCPNCGARMDEE